MDKRKKRFERIVGSPDRLNLDMSGGESPAMSGDEYIHQFNKGNLLSKKKQDDKRKGVELTPERLKELEQEAEDEISLDEGTLSKTTNIPRFKPNEDVSADIANVLRDYCNVSFDGGDVEIQNGLSVFTRVDRARKVFDSYPSLKVQWVINGEVLDIDDPHGEWNEKILKLSAEERRFIADFSLNLLFKVHRSVVGRWSGKLTFSATPQGKQGTDSFSYGGSVAVKLKFDFFDAGKFIGSIDDIEPSTYNRFNNLDFESRRIRNRKANKKNEMRRRTRYPFESLFKENSDAIIFRGSPSSISKSHLSFICLLATNGSPVGRLDGLIGDAEKTRQWFSDIGGYTKVELEGKLIYDGSVDREIEQKKLLATIIKEINSIPMGDSLLSTEYDLDVSVYDNDNKKIVSQYACISIQKDDFRDIYRASVKRTKDLRSYSEPSSRFSGLEFESSKRRLAHRKALRERLEMSAETMLYMRANFVPKFDYKKDIRFSPLASETAFCEELFKALNVIPLKLEEDHEVRDARIKKIEDDIRQQKKEQERQKEIDAERNRPTYKLPVHSMTESAEHGVLNINDCSLRLNIDGEIFQFNKSYNGQGGFKWLNEFLSEFAEIDFTRASYDVFEFDIILDVFAGRGKPIITYNGVLSLTPKKENLTRLNVTMEYEKFQYGSTDRILLNKSVQHVNRFSDLDLD